MDAAKAVQRLAVTMLPSTYASAGERSMNVLPAKVTCG